MPPDTEEGRPGTDTGAAPRTPTTKTKFFNHRVAGSASSREPNGQLSLDDVLPSGTVDATTGALLDLIDGDLVHERDRREIVRTILEVAHDSDGEIDPNEVRRRLPSWIFPRCVGPAYRALVTAGVLRPAGWVVSDDLKGRNSGKPCRRYELAAAELPAEAGERR